MAETTFFQKLYFHTQVVIYKLYLIPMGKRVICVIFVFLELGFLRYETCSTAHFEDMLESRFYILSNYMILYQLNKTAGFLIAMNVKKN